MMLMYLSTLALLKRKWEYGAIFFSIALGVKMNILLFAPGFALIYYRCVGLPRSILNAGIVILIQVK